MHRRLGSDVVEGEDVIVLIDLLTGDLAAQDLREDVVRVVDSGHRFGFSGGYGTRRSSVKPNRDPPKKVQATFCGSARPAIIICRTASARSRRYWCIRTGDKLHYLAGG